MGTIKIGRYPDDGINDESSITNEWSGWIEPEDRSWIIWLDTEGKPALYYAERSATGGVLGDGMWIREFVEPVTVEEVKTGCNCSN